MISVVGSLNSDQIIGIDKFVRKGETILGTPIQRSFGGKGGNQAVAASLLGADVAMIGATGQDEAGVEYVKHLENLGVNVEGVTQLANEPTGSAIVMVSDNDNGIIVLPGANLKLTSEDVLKHAALIENSNYVLVQFEIDPDVINTVLDVANQYQVPVIMNPAPFRLFPREWLDKVAYITPNETEFDMMQQHYDNLPLEKLIVTRGKEGVRLFDNGKALDVPAPIVDVVDTTGAGDTFNGALAVFLEEGYSVEEACEKAVCAASLSTISTGAQSSMPTRQNLQEKINE